MSMIKKITADTKEKLANKNFIVGTPAVKDTVENVDKMMANYFSTDELNEKSIKVGNIKWAKLIPYGDDGVALVWNGQHGNSRLLLQNELADFDVPIKAWDFIYHDVVNNKNYSLIDWINSKQNSATAINTSNIGSQSVANADTVDGVHFNWSIGSGEPTRLWGTTDAKYPNMYVYDVAKLRIHGTAFTGPGYGSAGDLITANFTITVSGIKDYDICVLMCNASNGYASAVKYTIVSKSFSNGTFTARVDVSFRNIVGGSEYYYLQYLLI